MQSVNVHDAKTRLSELLRRVERGEEFTIARGGHPVARLVAVAPPSRRQLGVVPDLAGIPDGAFFDPLDEDELRAWEGR